MEAGLQIQNTAARLNQGRSPVVFKNLDRSSTAQQLNSWYTACIVVYIRDNTIPQIHSIESNNDRDFIGTLSATTYSLVQEHSRDSQFFPYQVIYEACSNFIHANFKGIVISIVENGNTLVFSDSGNGIAYPTQALRVGFTSASKEMRQTIRGVGAGFTIIDEYIQSCSGQLTIEKNLQNGTVVTISRVHKPTSPDKTLTEPVQRNPALNHVKKVPIKEVLRPEYSITDRQKEVLAMLLNYDRIGPAIIAKSLEIGVATAHRDLCALEACGLIEKTHGKKNCLTTQGTQYLDYLLS